MKTKLLVSAFFSLALSISAQTVVSSLDPGVLNAALQGGGTVTFSVDGTIVLTNSIMLSNTVVLDGTNHSITLSGGGTVNIFNILGSGQVTLRHLILANGWTNGIAYQYGINNPSPGYGGAINSLGNLDVEECVFSNNIAEGGTSELSGLGGSAQQFTGNGGAIYTTGLLTVTNSLFIANSAIGASRYDDTDNVYGGNGCGGAICNNGGSLVMANVTFSNNAATGGMAEDGPGTSLSGSGYGGAIYSSGGSVAGTNVFTYGNTATGGAAEGQGEYGLGPGSSSGSAFGGAIFVSGSTLALTTGVILNNSATAGLNEAGFIPSGQAEGGGIFASGNSSLTQFTISGNQAFGAITYDFNAPTPGYGGAVYNSGQMQICDSTLSNNASFGGFYDNYFDSVGAPAYGGAIYNTGGMGIVDTSLVGNSATGTPPADQVFRPNSGWGGGIANLGFVQLSNTILSSNVTVGPTNNGEAIYNAGVIQADTASVVMPYVTGTPPLSYQWQSNAANLPGLTNATFNLSNVAFANAGIYGLAISNTAGLVANFDEILNVPAQSLCITSVSPNTGEPAGIEKVTIAGTGFVSGASIYFGGVQAPYVTALSSNSITAYTPPSTNIGPVNVTITNGDFQSFVFSNGFFYYNPAVIQLNASLNAGQGVQLQFYGVPSTNYVLLATTNLNPPINWQPIVTNATDTNGLWMFIDTNGLEFPVRFYLGELP